MLDLVLSIGPPWVHAYLYNPAKYTWLSSLLRWGHLCLDKLNDLTEPINVVVGRHRTKLFGCKSLDLSGNVTVHSEVIFSHGGIYFFYFLTVLVWVVQRPLLFALSGFFVQPRCVFLFQLPSDLPSHNTALSTATACFTTSILRYKGHPYKCA